MTDYTYEDVRQAVNRELKRRWQHHAGDDGLDKLYGNDISTALDHVFYQEIFHDLIPKKDLDLMLRARDQARTEQKIGDEPV